MHEQAPHSFLGNVKSSFILFLAFRESKSQVELASPTRTCVGACVLTARSDLTLSVLYS